MPRGELIASDEHVFVAGRTGSGKTYLARNYLAAYQNVVVLDTKGTLLWPEAGRETKIVTTMADLRRITSGRVIYRPRFEELNIGAYDDFFRWCYLRKNTIVWVDEVMSIAPGPLSMPEYYRACLTRGRERRVAVWSLTQRPTGIPLVAISEATHVFVFDLNLEADRKRIVAATGEQAFAERPGRYHFLYYNQTREKAPARGKIQAATRQVVNNPVR